MVAIATIIIHKSFANKNEPLIQLMSLSQMNNSSKPLNWKKPKSAPHDPGNFTCMLDKTKQHITIGKYVHVSRANKSVAVNDNKKTLCILVT